MHPSPNSNDALTDGDGSEVLVREDPASGLSAVIAIDDLTLGPAAGGVRRWRYPNLRAAVDDARALARGMTYKNALAGLPFGGGKAVILADEKPVTQAQLSAFGRFVEQLGGRYITAEDVGMSVANLVEVARETDFVTGIGRGGRGGDPGPKTAAGVFAGVEVIAERLGFAGVAGVRVAVQGLGNVGMSLCEQLSCAGVELVVADLDAQRVAHARRRWGARIVTPEDILRSEVDIVAPCALGAVINSDLAASMSARAVVGSANNQLANPQVAEQLRRHGIIYAPDYAVNAGGVISVAFEYLGRDDAAVEIQRIGARLADIVDRAEQRSTTTLAIADEMAERTLAQAAWRTGASAGAAVG